MSESWDVNDNMIKNYITCCKEFVENDALFKEFKRDPRYTPVLEHVNKEESLFYVSEMKDKEIITDSVLKKIKENDKFGDPNLFEYEEFGLISPSTIRYIKNSLDILNYFGQDFIYKKIVEIGGGYGGLCKVFSSFVNFEKYLLVDLPEPSKLSEKYLNKFSDIKDKITYVTTENIRQIKGIDLLISNYSFSECSEQYQKIYYEKVIKNSKRFYMLYNNFTENNINADKFIELASENFEVHVEYENRSLHKNYILYGTKK